MNRFNMARFLFATGAVTGGRHGIRWLMLPRKGLFRWTREIETHPMARLTLERRVSR